MKANKILYILFVTLPYHTLPNVLKDFLKNDKVIPELTTPEYVSIIKQFLPENPIILEAGAHGGQDTVILGQSWRKGKIYAFEPVSKFVDFINHEITKHKVTNASVFPFALSNVSGKSTFYYSTKIGAASSLFKDNGMCDYRDTQINVDCINLDEWALKNNVNNIDFMWLDMEGSEYRVLSSAPKILQTVKVIFIEANFQEFRTGIMLFPNLHQFLIKNGFTLVKIWGHPTWQGNALFVKSNLLKN